MRLVVGQWCRLTMSRKKNRGIATHGGTSKRAELVAFTIAFAELANPFTIQIDNMGILVGLWRSEAGCIAPKHKDADLWYKNVGAIDGAV